MPLPILELWVRHMLSDMATNDDKEPLWGGFNEFSYAELTKTPFQNLFSWDFRDFRYINFLNRHDFHKHE